MMNVNIANGQTTNVQQYLNLNKLQNNAMNGCTVVNAQPSARFTVSLNGNVNNVSSVFFRNAQLSPMKQSQQQQQQQSRSSSLGLAQQQSSNSQAGSSTNNNNNNNNVSAAGLNLNNLDGYRNTITSTLNSLNNYSINLQNQLNYAKQQQAAVAAAAAAAAAASGSIGPSSILTAASVLNTANSLASQMQNNQMYQSMQQQQQQTNTASTTCNLNNTLFVGNLHASLQEIDLIQVFRPFGRIVECCKKWLHFGFVKFTSEEEACHAYVTLNGFRLKGRPMRLEFQNRTKKARIKAILAQAALQATNGNGQANDLLALNGLGMGGNGVAGLSFHGLDERSSQQHAHHQHHHQQHQQQQQSYFHQMACANAGTLSGKSGSSFLSATSTTSTTTTTKLGGGESASSVNSFFNADQLIKFASGGSGAAGSASTLDTFDLNQLDFSGSLGGAINNNNNNYFDLNDNDLAPPSLSSSSSSSASSSSSLTSIKQYTTTTINNTHSSSFDFKLTDDLIKDFASLSTDVSKEQAKQPQPSSLSSSSSSSSSTSSSVKPSQNNLQTSDELIMSLIKKTISPSITPNHDLSSSSDSGCRSNSFIALNDEDSAIGSLQSTTASTKSSCEKKQKQHGTSTLPSPPPSSSMLCVDELTISEHLEFTCSNSSPVNEVVDLVDESEVEESAAAVSAAAAASAALDVEEEDEDETTERDNNKKLADVVEEVDVEDVEEDEEEDSQSDTDSDCDTSDDASEIPTDAECLNELDLIDENFLNGGNDYDHLVGDIDIITPRYNNVVDKDGTITRKKLHSGIYKSMNQTLSLFIEPHDVLKQMDHDEFNEYILFPQAATANTATPIDSLFHFYLI